MNRAGIVIALLFAMLWQSIALARAGSTVEAVSDPAHAALHWQDEGHHHHDDGSHHFDDSDDSVQHLFVDHVTAPVALLHAVSTSMAPLGSCAPSPQCVSMAPQPFIDGPLRPPRLAA
ncbi:MAG: hypothetical protein H0U56_00420 [Methylibium sp.]|uniref:hypothetical protein n=1 Tax=Methylibium sp. TaxID=2067992 RepID=UPI0018209ECE|nr:hypothetical protein [Methylibium sp.]MBA2721371.1 hypothetical protein [Methylibium sp.]MBA3590179.1 hypothetical protein [Methylibium sp.]